MEQDQKIFKSNFHLTYQSQEIEKEYEAKTTTKIQNNTLYYTIFLFVLALSGTLMHCFSYSVYLTKFPNYLPVLYTSMILSSIYVVLIAICLIAYCLKKNVMTLRIVNYINFYLIVLIFGVARNHVINVSQDAFGYASICMIEFLFRQVYMVLGALNFKESYIILILDCATYWLYWPFFSSINMVYSRLLTFNVLWLTETIMFYFYLRQEKITFFYIRDSENRCNWYMNLFENMNTGFLRIKNGVIEYANKEIYNKIKNEINIRGLLQDTETKNLLHLDSNNLTDKNLIIEEDKLKTNNLKQNLIHKKFRENTGVIIEGILDGIVPEFLNSEDNETALYNYTNSQSKAASFLTLLKSEAINTERTNTFILIGTKTFEIYNEVSRKTILNNLSEINPNVNQADTVVSENYKVSFEIYCRYYKATSDSGDNYEFIFNDVTNTEIIMEKKANEKYKSVFLAKIAHEFKNPLIAVSELANQINDKIKSKQINTISESTRLIKSLSDYLILLIRDMDYLAHRDAYATNSNIYYEDLMKYCKNIAECLLFNSNRQNNVNFAIKLDDRLKKRYFVSNETKLKQILINLIANSIKHTNAGQIKLEMELSNTNQILFQISNSETNQQITKESFNPLMKGYQNNSESSRLGLMIVKTLIESLRSRLEYSIEPNKGTKIWFFLNLDPKTNNIVSNSNYCIINEEDINQKYNPDIIPEPSCNSNNSLDSNHFPEIKFNTRNTGKFSFDNMSEQTVKIENIKLTRPIPKSIMATDNMYFSSLQINYNNSIFINHPNIDSNITNEFPGSNSFRTKKASKIKKKSTKCNNFDSNDANIVNIIIVDDETITRQAAIRVIRKFLNKNRYTANIIEAQDGIECLSYFYQYLTRGKKIDCIISDETMCYMNGSVCAQIIKRILINKNIDRIPFCIITAYEDNVTLKTVKNEGVEVVYTKPITQTIIEKILTELYLDKN